MAFTPRLVLVTTPTLEQGRILAGLLLEKRLAVCVNLVPGIESHYRWQNKLETGAEVLLLIKSSAEQFEPLRELVALHHPYECPEIVALRPEEIAPAYRLWWEGGLG
jgi:periplasmic divalent cation tolerance protein